MKFWRDFLITPIGALEIVVSENGVRTVGWKNERLSRGLHFESTAAPMALEAAKVQLGEYFAGKRMEFDLPLDLLGSPFQMLAWKALCSIPFGETVSYSEQARRIGNEKKARAIGGANNRNPIAIIVPCHRVVGKDGSLTGYAAGIERKRYLLALEAASKSAGLERARNGLSTQLLMRSI